VKIGVDGRSLAGPARGVGHYTSALLAAWPPGDELVVAGRRPRRAYAAGALVGRPVLVAGCDVLLLPAPAPVAPGPAPYVLTVHDRSWESRPRDFTAYERLWHRVARPRALARGAARVIAVSRATADDVARAWGVECTVVANAPRPLPPPGPGPARPYFLWVGALEPRKAPDVLARAWARARPDADLRVVGEGRLGVPGAIREGHVSDERLATLYAHARALVVPSWLEGFGMPAAEALAMGTPVIAGNVAALREVCGPDARYVAPGDVDALAHALADPPPPPSRRPPRTWSDVARETRAVLAEAARC
jgi:glycosyltransferase involved in cell wall biosynthesis